MTSSRRVLITCWSCHTTRDVPTSYANRESVRDGTYVCRECFDKHVTSGLRAKPPLTASCRGGCGRTRTVRVRAKLTRLPTYDAATSSYLCRACNPEARRRLPVVSRVLRCRRCGAIPAKQMQKSYVAALTTYDAKSHTHLCRHCFARDNGKRQHARMLTKMGLSKTDPPEYRSVLERQQASVARDTILRKRGIPRSASLAERNRVLGEHIRAGKAAGTPRAKRIETPFMEPMRGDYVLCLLCHKLLYRLPGERGLHAACYRQWQGSPESREWRRKRGDPRDHSPEAELRRRAAGPPPQPAGATKPPNSQSLAMYLRWLAKERLQHKSLADIAREEGYSKGNVQHGLERLERYLPESWLTVFGNPRKGSKLDSLLPIGSAPAR